MARLDGRQNHLFGSQKAGQMKLTAIFSHYWHAVTVDRLQYRWQVWYITSYDIAAGFTQVLKINPPMTMLSSQLQLIPDLPGYWPCWHHEPKSTLPATPCYAPNPGYLLSTSHHHKVTKLRKSKCGKGSEMRRKAGSVAKGCVQIKMEI